MNSKMNSKKKEIEALLRVLLEMDPEIVQKVIAVANLEVARLKKLRPEPPDKLLVEDHNFRVNSDGWKKITVGSMSYLENPEKDIWEIVTGNAKGEQLFTWNAAMRETEKASKRMPTDKEFTELLKVKEDLLNLILAGYRDTNGSFDPRGTNASLWSSTESGASAWLRFLYSGYSTVYRDATDKAYGFSVRCVKS